MKSRNFSRIFYFFLLLALLTPIILASVWFDKGGTAKDIEIGIFLYFFPMIFVVLRVWLGQVNHFVFAIFICMLILLEVYTYSVREDQRWIFSLLEIPVIWLFGGYTFISTAKYFESNKNS